MNIKETQWHQLNPDDVLKGLNSHRSGLKEADARERLNQYGPNLLQGKKKTSPIVVFLYQFLSPLIYVLLAAGIVSLITSHYIDAVVILGVLILNAVIGFLQESRAEKAMAALLALSSPKARVRRDGVSQQIPVTEVVHGDILLLEAGDKVSADARLIESSNLKVNEAMLTGESMPVDKHSSQLSSSASLNDRKNMVFMGTIATYGRATAVAVKTGMATEIGSIAHAIEDIKREKTPLQKSINRLSQYLLIAILAILSILVFVSLCRGTTWQDTFFLAVAIAVSAIPEGLPAVITVVLAVGMQYMARRSAIVRKLAAVETLGSATVICSDKTGTLTLNKMTVQHLFIGNELIDVTGEGYEPKGAFWKEGIPFAPDTNQLLQLHLRIATLCNDALLTCEKDFCGIFGDPTEGALVVVAAKAGLEKEKLEQKYPRLDEIPFQSERQFMVTLHRCEEGGKIAYVKGSVERMLEYCGFIATRSSNLPLLENGRQSILQANDKMTGSAMRVIATAYARLPEETDELREEDIKGNLTFVGLAGMEDPPRPEAIVAVKLCKQAGIKVVMITGDNKNTAKSIASKLFLPEGRALTSSELKQMSDEQLSLDIEEISVFARIEPLQKLKIVDAFKARGHVVAMTGDGINDAPALKSANIGIAMGITGTDVAKEASDMVLADDNFASVVAAVDEGRAIFNRLRNVVFFLLSTNFGELLAFILCVGIIGQAPLLALQIIWVNLVTDTAAAIPLGLEPKSGDELNQPPRHPRVGLIFPGLLARIIFMAALMGTGIFIIFNWAIAEMGIKEARTLAFCTMVVFEWFRAFNARSDEHSVLKLGLSSNRWLLLTISIAILLQLAVVYLPFMQVAFETVPLSIDKWGIAILAGGSMFLIEEIRKMLFPKLFSTGKWQPLGKAK
ncbi:MAG: HAD-IC family P-type ATPase [Dehalococcoidia bacterium]|nr:HAD-IC family P-type ATPase [Dehalococcoidia bacterium]